MQLKADLYTALENTIKLDKLITIINKISITRMFYLRL